ncbi:MAG: adenylate/guanylate cyclase domain-containing protein [bacterium]|nr:adenylate/guanylate cyclase domain-containing protein [bacterium]
MSSETIERRLAAVLSADIVGYSRLMADDEDATVNTLRSRRDLVSQLIPDHRGRLVDFTGDNFLAEFPSAIDALRCALEIQANTAELNEVLPEARRMRFRIGAHLGDLRSEGERIFGEGVNIAARLEALAEPDGICVSSAIRDQVRNKLDLEFTDLGPRDLKNIPEPVHAFAVGAIEGEGSRPRAGTRRFLWVAAGVFLVVGLLLTWVYRGVSPALEFAALAPPSNPALPSEPSIIVLPFDNLSDDPEQEYFSDGITEDLTTDLSQIPRLFVIARNSAFTYKGKPIDVVQVGREMGVRYVLEGSVRKAEDTVRITAQLIDAGTGFHVWSARYDRKIAGLFALQSEISEEILAALSVELQEAEIRRMRSTRPNEVSAYDAFTRGFASFLRFRHAGHEDAARWFERAIEIEPDYARAHAFLGLATMHGYTLGWSMDVDALERAEALAQRAFQINPRQLETQYLLTQLNLARGRPGRGLEAARKGVQLAPRDNTAIFLLGLSLVAAEGDLKKGGSLIREALRRNPRPPASWWTTLASTRYLTGRREEAVAIWERSRGANPDEIHVRIALAWHYATNGARERASEIVREIRVVNPELTPERARDLIAPIGTPMRSEELLEALQRAFALSS